MAATIGDTRFVSQRMTPRDMGLHLRALVIADREAGLAVNPQRLMAVVSDLAGQEHTELVAPLRNLILSAAFASAAGQEPPLAGWASLPRLRHELAQMYAEPVCARLQPVLEGLLELPAGAGAAAPARAGAAGINSVLVLLCGALLLALASLIGLWRLQHPQAGDAQPTPPAPAPAASPPTTYPRTPMVRAIPAPSANTGSASVRDLRNGADSAAEAVSRAKGSVEQLVSALSGKEYGQVNRRIGRGAADQFESGFYNQFDSVSVQELRSTGQQGSIVEIEGVMVFRWPDGSHQSETRRFSVDSDQEPPRILSSSFERVLKER